MQLSKTILTENTSALFLIYRRTRKVNPLFFRACF